MELACGVKVVEIPKQHLNQSQISLWEKWITALESGRYVQTISAMKRVEGEYCVLGVACDVIDPTRWSKRPDRIGDICYTPLKDEKDISPVSYFAFVPPDIARLYGFPLSEGGLPKRCGFDVSVIQKAPNGKILFTGQASISQVNDFSATFSELAMIIKLAMSSGYKI